MPRKRASGSSPEKPAATPRRNTRRGRNKSEEAEETAAAIPRHLLNSDESDEEEDNDSDYGSPKKGRGGRAAKATTGRGRKAKDTTVAEDKPAARPRRGRRAAAAVRDSSPQNIAEEADNSQSTQETQETAETTENEATEPITTIHSTDNSAHEQEPIQTTSEPVTQVDEDKVSEVTIEQDLRSNNDQAPVNEEEDGGNESDVETGRESVDKVIETPEVEPETIVLNEEESKEAPESSNQSESRSNSSEKEVYRRKARSSSPEIIDDSCDKMDVDTSDRVAYAAKSDVEISIRVQEEEKAPEPKEKVEEAVPVKEKPVEEKSAALQKRKRKWTAPKNDDTPVIAITTDSLKNIISEEVKPVPLSDIKLMSASPEPEPEEKRIRTKPTADDKDARKKLLMERLRKQEEEEERRNEQLVKAIDKSQAPSNGTSANGSMSKDRKVSIILDAPPSPPKNDCSNILYITNLVRPFTVLQLKGLLARTGKIVENGFWIDKIKSKCFVKYETEDEAVETRHALHGVIWPSSNPKFLQVDFGKQDDMDKAIVSTLEEMPRIQITTENRDLKDEKDFGWSKDPTKASGVDDRSRGSNRPVREWDVGKKDKEDHERDDRDRNRRKRSQDRENRREKDQKKDERPERRRSVSDSPGRKTDKPDGEVQPVRLLDDLFRKTKATPCVYWLPLSAEQIIEKEEQRQKNLAENERRMEEIRKQREERLKDRRRSNSRDRSRRDRSRDRRRRSVSRDRRYNRR